MKHFFSFLLCLLAVGANAQNIQRETMQVEYISRPSEPLPGAISNYDVLIEAAVEEADLITRILTEAGA